MVVLHDAFKPLSSWQGFMPYPRYSGVSMCALTDIFSSRTSNNLFFFKGYSYLSDVLSVACRLERNWSRQSRMQAVI